MNLSVDTHALLWWLGDSTALSQAARAAIIDDRNIVVVSAAVVWEIRKRSVGHSVGHS